MHHLYVYYKVRPVNATRLRPMVQKVQAQLANRLGGHFVVRYRPELDADGCETWIEVYENVQSDFESLLQHAITASGLDAWIAGPRHAERFVDF